ncbi:MAG TPA: DUF3253 domain-containing protein [Prosthecobacter sp.]
MSDGAIRKTLLELAAEREGDATFCPSEAARRLSTHWRPLMPQVRQVAAVLVKEGRLRCTQRGEPADPLAAKGPIRLAWGSQGGH